MTDDKKKPIDLKIGENSFELILRILGNEFVGLGGTPRPGEAGIQAQRLESRGVLPSGLGAIDRLGGNLGTPTGAATDMPSGQTVGR